MDKLEPQFDSDAPNGPGAEQVTDDVTATVLLRMEESRRREREVMEELFAAQILEQRRARRAKNWFRGFIVLYLILLVWIGTKDHWSHGMEDSADDSGSYTAVVDLVGTIMPDTAANAESVLKNVKDAFEDSSAKAVILRINSPGGSPVQAGIMFDELRRLQEKHPDKPLYAVLEDICASGGYYVAAAAKEIYADKATLVGSIGVIMRGFGAEEAIKKLGIESRTLTAGDRKAFMDPFSPMSKSDKAHAETLLGDIHRQFVETVKTGRGNRLKGPDSRLFTGLIWTGEEAVNLGLVDGLGSALWVAREKVKAEKLVNFSGREHWIDRLSEKLVDTAQQMLWPMDRTRGFHLQ
ncbi:MAG: S49 family peptidase [Magnetococcales bacterium]|nr:S49 family peptidase [Magnetococcales bacterium]